MKMRRRVLALVLALCLALALAGCGKVSGRYRILETLETQSFSIGFRDGDYVQYYVEAALKVLAADGTVQRFEGMSLLRWTPEGKIAFLQEFGCNLERYDPYAAGPEPVFREEKALWF